MVKLLFICGRNRLRSPTADRVFGGIPGIEAMSAGVAPDADNPLTPDSLAWADVIFVMEPRQRSKLTKAFTKVLKGKRIVCLAIPDVYRYMQPELIDLLWERVPRSVPALSGMKVRTNAPAAR